MNLKSFIRTLLVTVMLSCVTGISAQKHEGQSGNQSNSLSKLMNMLGNMTDEQKGKLKGI